ncbi:YecR family lipoprotein [Pseudomonas sp. NPDC096950]|uniref:YecR family lipoprotein n=1 Tax=Pseudomonas sp. NPDC096950 TaxID=3364485 RepID=UPI00383B0C4E
MANSKCAVWGYNRAEPFGGQTQNCQVRDGWGNCSAGQMIVKYQCIGNITPATQASTAGSASVPSGMLSPDQYKEARVKALMDQNLPYGEYMKQYRKIMAE